MPIIKHGSVDLYILEPTNDTVNISLSLVSYDIQSGLAIYSAPASHAIIYPATEELNIDTAFAYDPVGGILYMYFNGTPPSSVNISGTEALTSLILANTYFTEFSVEITSDSVDITTMYDAFIEGFYKKTQVLRDASLSFSGLMLEDSEVKFGDLIGKKLGFVVYLIDDSFNSYTITGCGIVTSDSLDFAPDDVVRESLDLEICSAIGIR